MKVFSPFRCGEGGKRRAFPHPLGLTTVDFGVTAVPSFLLTKVIGKHLEDISIIGWSLLIGGIVMWLVDALNAKSEASGPRAPRSRLHTRKMEEMSLRQSILIRLCPIFSTRLSRTSRSTSP